MRTSLISRLRCLVAAVLLSLPIALAAQVGQYRNTLSVGFGGGVNLSSVGFNPSVSQNMLAGPTFGISARYLSEKYFTALCSVQAEINYSQLGWKENIRDAAGNPVPALNPSYGQNEEYQRAMHYIQMPVMAHLAWGKEEKGLSFFIQAGPQIGYMLSEKVRTNFSYDERNTDVRANAVYQQDSLSVENKFDYGIAAGAGVEYTHPRAGHFILEGRYYYGLGNIFGDSKADFFGKSNHGVISIKLGWMMDINRKKQSKLK